MFVRIQSIGVVNLLIVDLHFNIGKNWVQNVFYMSNKKNWSVFLRSLFLFCFCFFFLFFFYFFGIVSFVTTTLDKFQFQSRVRLSQINVIVPIRLKIKLCAVQIEWGSSIDLLFIVHGTTRHRQLLRRSLQDLKKLPQKVGTENYSTWSMRNVCKNVSPRPTDLFCRFCWNDCACLPYVYGSFLLLATTTQLFSQSLSSHILCSCLETLSTTSNLCNFWHSKFQQVSTYAFCSWDDVFTQKWNRSSPNNLCKGTKSPSTLSTNTSVKWNLYFSWINHIVTSFRLEMIVGSFSEHQNKTSDTDRYKGYFFTARVSQVNVNTMKRVFEQRSELQVAKFLIVHVLSSSYNVSSHELRNKRQQRSNVVFVSPTIFYSIRLVYITRECMRTMS